jgi:hypothetical protein
LFLAVVGQRLRLMLPPALYERDDGEQNRQHAKYGCSPDCDRK